MPSISIQPPTLDLSLYAGDGISFRLICQDEAGDEVDVTGDIEAQIRLDRSPTSSPIVEFTADVSSASTGIIGLSLTGEQTQELMADPSAIKGKFGGVWDVQWTAIGSEPRTLCQGKVECLADVTR